MGRSHTIFLLCLLLAASPLSFAAEALVAVASNFGAPARELASRFEQESGHTLKLAQGSSGKLFTQVRNGAPFDVFLSADQAFPARLVEQASAVQGSQFTYALGALALWSASDKEVLSADSLSALASDSAASASAKIAIANPRIAPYGLAAQQVMDSLALPAGTAERLAARIVYGENIAQAFQFVQTGNARMGFVALSQVLALTPQQRGAYWRVPSALHAPIRQDAVLLSRGENNLAARAFLHFLRGETARTILQRYGYEFDVLGTGQSTGQTIGQNTRMSTEQSTEQGKVQSKGSAQRKQAAIGTFSRASSQPMWVQRNPRTQQGQHHG